MLWVTPLELNAPVDFRRAAEAVIVDHILSIIRNRAVISLSLSLFPLSLSLLSRETTGEK